MWGSVMFYQTILRSCVLIIAACVMVFANVQAETPEFGEISDEEWSLGPPKEYSHAKAVIIFDEGIYTVSRGKRILDHHVRIKIFNKEGALDIADVELKIHEGDKIKKLEAHTITPDGKKIVVKEFYDKKVEKVDVKAFTFPAIEDGSIIEYKYHLVRNRYGIKTWYFQNDIFTMRSAVTIKQKLKYWAEPVCTNIPIEFVKIAEETFDENNKSKDDYRLELTNLMPAKSEPLMGARLDNLVSLKFSSKRSSGKTAAYGWNDIGKWLTEWYDSDANTSLKKIKKVSDSICGDLDNDEEKTRRLFSYVANEIKTDNDLDAAKKLADIMKNRKGIRYEKSHLLRGLLKVQDIPAKLMYIGTRKQHGKLNALIRSTSQLNRLLCYVDYDTAGYVLDPGAECAIFPYPIANDLAEQGLLFDGEESRLLGIPHTPRINGTDMMPTLHINDDGSASFSTTIIIKGYSMEPWLEKRNDSISDLKIAEEMLEDLEVDFEIEVATLTLDMEKDRMLFEIILDLPDFASIVDENIFFTPFILPVKENPFDSDHRIFPIDFSYKFLNKQQTQVYLPENMTVGDVPKNIYQKIEGARLTRRITSEGNQVFIKAQFEVSRPSFPPASYPAIKELFDLISESSLDQILAIKTQSEDTDL
jgi:hypothetical protein